MQKRESVEKFALQSAVTQLHIGDRLVGSPLAHVPKDAQQ